MESKIKKLLNKISIWLYKKTSVIGQRMEFKFTVKIGENILGVNSVLTNYMLSQECFPLFIDNQTV